jgi:hypothetical protein
LLVLAVAALFLPRGGDRAVYPAGPGETAVIVYVIDNGLHSDLVLPTAPLRLRSGAMAEALESLPPTAFVTLGWGDARFFADSSPEAGRLLDGVRALLAPGNVSLIRLESLDRPPQQAYRERVLALSLSARGFDRLAARLDRSFASPAALAPPFPRRASDARYFPSVERFSLLHLCNHWTGELLAAAGLSTRPGLDTVAEGLAFDLRTFDGATRVR